VVTEKDRNLILPPV